MAALRDWVANGDESEYVLSDEEFARRVKPRSPAEMEAEASFKLAVWFQQAGDTELATKYFERAQALNPDDWNYHRQEWSFTRRSRQEVAGEVQGVRQGVLPEAGAEEERGLGTGRLGARRSTRHSANKP